MKTKEELDALKEEVKSLNAKLAELTEEELEEVAGGDVTSANIVGYRAAVGGQQPSTEERIMKVPGSSSWQFFE